jgi:hypothetical protein
VINNAQNFFDQRMDRDATRDSNHAVVYEPSIIQVLKEEKYA